MAKDKIEGYIKTEAAIWFVIAALFVGFLGGVVFGVYKSASLIDVDQASNTGKMDASSQEAIEAFKARVSRDPGDREAWIQMGHRYFDMQCVDEAIDAYEKALAIDDRDADVWTDLGVMYRRAGNPQKAVQAFDNAISIDPSHEISRFNKGIVLFHDLKDQKGALEAWQSLLDIDPDAKSPDGMPVRQLIDHFKKNIQEPK